VGTEPAPTRGKIGCSGRGWPKIGIPRAFRPLTRARDGALAAALDARHICHPMAGSPIKRMRKAGITNPITGELVPFPCMPRVADLPTGWRHFSAAQKIEHLIGLDRCYEILSWPLAGLDPLRLSIKVQVIRVVFRICAKAMLDGTHRVGGPEWVSCPWPCRPPACGARCGRSCERASGIWSKKRHPAREGTCGEV
jgi:hypothetical protein